MTKIELMLELQWIAYELSLLDCIAKVDADGVNHAINSLNRLKGKIDECDIENDYE